MGIIHALDRARKYVERGGTLVRRDWSGFQFSVPWLGNGDGTVRRGRGVRDGFTERGEREVEFCGDRPEEFGVDTDHFRERAGTPD